MFLLMITQRFLAMKTDHNKCKIQVMYWVVNQVVEDIEGKE